jgi:hypothetical protein
MVSLDPRQLDVSFSGRSFDERFLDDLPAEVDPFGENGEFHTFVHAGPIFDERIECEVGGLSLREGFAFCDVRPTPRPKIGPGGRPFETRVPALPGCRRCAPRGLRSESSWGARGPYEIVVAVAQFRVVTPAASPRGTNTSAAISRRIRSAEPT